MFFNKKFIQIQLIHIKYKRKKSLEIKLISSKYNATKNIKKLITI